MEAESYMGGLESDQLALGRDPWSNAAVREVLKKMNTYQGYWAG